MADKDEPRREAPQEIFPEWTTRPHSVTAESGPAPPRERPRPVRSDALRALLWLVATAGLVLFAFFFMAKGSRRFAPQPGGGSEIVAPDLQIQEAARDRLARDARLASLRITVVCREQILTVSGRVPDDATRESVLNLVRMTPNASGVIDRLEVGGEPGR